jgi:hypothetical protein
MMQHSYATLVAFRRKYATLVAWYYSEIAKDLSFRYNVARCIPSS